MSPEEFELYERYERAVQVRKHTSWRLSEFLDDDVLDALGMTPAQAIAVLRYELSDFPVFPP